VFQSVKLVLVVPVNKPALEFALRHRDKIFPNVPMVFTAVDAELELSDWRNWPGVTGYAPCEAIKPTIGLALRLHPDATTVAIISHDTGVWWAAAHSELLRHKEVKEIDIIGPPDGQMIERVATLPSHTVALYQVIISENAQPAIGVYDAAEMVARRLPTYSPFANLVLGRGGVGGASKKYVKEAETTGELAGRVLLGERPEDIPIVRDCSFQILVDWRALQRWQIPETSLPPGSVVLYREPSLWERYRKYLIAAIAVIVIQFLFIFGLLWQRARRRKTEDELRRSEERFFKSFRQSPLPITITDTDDGRYIDVNEAFEKQTGWQRDEVIGRSPLDIDLWVDPDQRGAFIKKLLAQGHVRDLEVRFRRKDGQIRTGLGSAEMIEVHGERCALSVIADITERKFAEEALAGVSRKLIEAHEEERTWIARELHDDINQKIALLAVNLGSLKQDRASSNGQATRVEDIQQQVQDLGSDIQALSHRLHSSKLDYLGLASACAGFCKELSERQNVEIDFHSESIPKDLSKEISLCLFRVLQEALQNAVKHSGSRHFQVSLRGAINEIELTVHDSGVGFDPEKAITGHGLGLTSMKERLKLVDGKLAIDSKLQSGTTIYARVPLAARIEFPSRDPASPQTGPNDRRRNLDRRRLNPSVCEPIRDERKEQRRKNLGDRRDLRRFNACPLPKGSP